MCNINFPTKEQFHLHITKSHPRCSTCGRYFEGVELLKHHQNETNCKDTSNKINSKDSQEVPFSEQRKSKPHPDHETNAKATFKQDARDKSLCWSCPKCETVFPKNKSCQLLISHLRECQGTGKESDSVNSTVEDSSVRKASIKPTKVKPTCWRACWVCLECHLTFASSEALVKHKKEFHTTCFACNQTFPNRDELHKHQSATRPGYTFKCCKCKVNCENQTELRQHMLGHRSKKCHICGESVNDETLLPQHFTLKHLERVDTSEDPSTFTKLWHCSNCKSVFSTSQYLIAHQKECTISDTSLPNNGKEIQPSKKSTISINTGQPTSGITKSQVHSVWKCSSCKITFTAKGLFLEHNREFHPVCAICNKQFIDRQSLNSHQSAKKLGFQFKCCRCNVVCRDQTEFEQHINGHQDNRCHVCGETVIFQRSLPWHFETKHYGLLDIFEPNPMFFTVQPEKVKIPCSRCNSIFDTNQSLIAHRRESHTECFSCGTTFLCKVELMNHQRATKAGYLFKCCTCKVNCKTQCEFGSHLSGHIFNKCHICQQILNNQTLLKNHYKAAHSEITESWQCTFCNITFSHGDLFDAHYRKWHTECLVCDRNFQDKVSLVKHQQWHWDGFRFKCCDCNALCRNKTEFEEHINGHLLNKCHAMVTDQITIPIENVGNLQSKDGICQPIGQYQNVNLLSTDQDTNELQQAVLNNEDAVKQTLGQNVVDIVPLSKNDIKHDVVMDMWPIKKSVVPQAQFQLKQENPLYPEEIQTNRGGINENPNQVLHFSDIRDNVKIINGNRPGIDEEIKMKVPTMEDTVKSEVSMDKSSVKSEPMTQEEKISTGSNWNEKCIMECALIIESEKNPASKLVFEIKEESKVDAPDLAAAGNMPYLVDVKPMENCEIIDSTYSADSYKAHGQREDSGENHKCLMCLQKFSKLNTLQRHLFSCKVQRPCLINIDETKRPISINKENCSFR